MQSRIEPAWRRLGPAALLLAVAVPTGTLAARRDADRGAPVDYRRDIRPILSDNCYTCHGPDVGVRKAGLRLDLAEHATAELPSGARAIVPGDASASALLRRVLASEERDRMPPLQTGKELSTQEIDALRRWIEEGAVFEEHWAFAAPERSPLPEMTERHWPRNEVDHFVLARQEAAGLTPSPEASREALIRRVTLDLTGLPPTLEEIDAFLADRSPLAYERVVARLLRSPAYGEHMARFWLDAARFGDTHGLHLDNERSLWRWREWVIGAFDDNLPFDDFTIDQLAGDLLPHPTLEQRIATGFNRCNVTTGEGGLIPEEYLVKYAKDRVETTGPVWLGLTVGCAQCHDHKFDPVSQKEFYGLFAFFNSVAEAGSDSNALTPPPMLKAPSPAQERELEALRGEIRSTQRSMNAPLAQVDAAQAEWEARCSARLQARWRVLEPEMLESREGATLRLLGDSSILATGPNPDRDVHVITAEVPAAAITGIRLEALRHESLVNGGAGRAENSNFVLTEIDLEVAPPGQPERFERVPLVVAAADLSQQDFDVAKAIDGDADSGWAVDARPEDRTAVFHPARAAGFAEGTRVRVTLRYQSRFARHAIGHFRLSFSADHDLLPATMGPWSQVGPFPAASGDAAHETVFGPESADGLDPDRSFRDGTLSWVTREELVDGQIHQLSGTSCATYLQRTIHSPGPRTMTWSLGSDDAIKIWLNGDVVLDRKVARGVAPDQDRVTVSLRPGDNHLLMKVVNYGGGYAFYFRSLEEYAGEVPPALARVLEAPAGRRTGEQRTQLRDYYRRLHSPAWRRLRDRLEQLRGEERALDARIPVTMVMQELPTPRPAYFLHRGQYDQPREQVERDVPAVFPAIPEGAPHDRLGLARWLVDPSHPLTARVTVNRLWQQLFGSGIVVTTEDFGAQGAWPSHPALLDWLAVEFVESGWDVKRLLRLLVTSATYRQSSRVTERLLQADPDNRLLARGPRLRLEAETVRDQALAVSGLLVHEIGGPSVNPYQPPGLWRAVAYPTSNTSRFAQGTGDDLYRRSLYTFWKRTSPPPSMTAFDAPSRESCVVRRARTNTPLQALVLLNDVQFVEAARHLAQRALQEGGDEPQARITHAFRLATARRPTPGESAVLREFVDQQQAIFQAQPELAEALIQFGDRRPAAGLDPAELAAWTAVASMILNLDETVTKG